jgi:hypothetical protein
MSWQETCIQGFFLDPAWSTFSSSRSWTKSIFMYCSTNSSILSHQHWHSCHDAKSQNTQKMRFPQPSTSDSVLTWSIQEGHGTWLYGRGRESFTTGVVDCCVARRYFVSQRRTNFIYIEAGWLYNMLEVYILPVARVYTCVLVGSKIISTLSNVDIT